MRTIVALAILLSSPPAFAGDLSADEIRSELVGQTLTWWENDGWFSGLLTLRPGGHAELQVETPKAGSDQGRWTLEGNRICTVWQGLRSGSAKCYSVSRGDAGLFVTSGGNTFRRPDAGV